MKTTNPLRGAAGLAVAALLSLPPGAAAGERPARSLDIAEFLRTVAPSPDTLAAAGRLGLPMAWTPPPGDPGAARPGDRVVALLCLTSLDGRLAPRQWILRLRLASPPARPASPAPAALDATYYSNVGDTFVFHSELSPMDLESLGPVLAGRGPGPRADAKQAGIAVCTDFLTLDLGRAADVIFRMKRQEGGSKSPLSYTFSAAQTPFPPEGLDATRRSLAAFGLTPDERRSFAGAVPALMQFLDIVRGTPDLSGILMEVLDKPSIIDVMRSGASSHLNFAFIGGGPFERAILFPGDPAGAPLRALAFNLEAFGKPVLCVFLMVAPPRPPLEVSAGIVGLAAWSPGHPDKLVAVRVVAAGRGGAAPAAP